MSFVFRSTPYYIWLVLVALWTVAAVPQQELPPQEADESANTTSAANMALGDLNFTPKENLLHFTLLGFRDMSKVYVDHAAQIAGLLLKDSNLTASSSPLVVGFRKNLTEFMENVHNSKELDELFSLVDLYSNMTAHYLEIGDNEAATPQALLIKGKLQQYGSHELDKEFEKGFLVFLQSFYSGFDEWKAKLSAQELQQESKMLKWLEDFKLITNVEEKIVAFERFLEFFEEV